LAQAVVRPYLESKFCLQGVSSTYKGTVFGAYANMSFASWVYNWLKQLINGTTGGVQLLQRCPVVAARIFALTLLDALTDASDFVGCRVSSQGV
jgi:hypothetical protein